MARQTKNSCFAVLRQKKKPKKPDFSYSDIAKHVAKKRSVYRLNNNSKVLMKYTGLRNYLKLRKIVIE